MGSNFDGKYYRNMPDRPHPGFKDGLKWWLDRDPGPWDSSLVDALPGPKPVPKVGKGSLRVTFINHATVLIQTDGLNILTDPIWAERASPVSWAGPKRVRPPGIRFTDLPSIDTVLVSHNHYDHLCRETLKRILDRDDPRVYTGLGNGKLLQKIGFTRIREMDWWQTDRLAGRVQLTFVPAQHFSNRGLADRYETLWGGFVIQSAAGEVYFAGDTGSGPHFREIHERLGRPDLALLPIGAYKPRSFMGPLHMSPADAVQAHRQLRARHSLAIHFGTFPLGDDGQWEPLEDLDRALSEAGLTREEFWVLEFGEGRDLPRSEEKALAERLENAQKPRQHE